MDSFIFGVSTTAQESIKQAAMINLIADSTVFVPQMIGDTTSAQVALSTAMASASANSSYRTMAKIAESSMPLIRNAVHIVILALFPIVMLLIIVAGSKGGMVLKTYLMALVVDQPLGAGVRRPEFLHELVRHARCRRRRSTG